MMIGVMQERSPKGSPGGTISYSCAAVNLGVPHHNIAMDHRLTGVVLDPYFPGSRMLPTPAGYTGTARLGLSHHWLGRISSPCAYGSWIDFR
jgi:hypothetical protein